MHERTGILYQKTVERISGIQNLAEAWVVEIMDTEQIHRSSTKRPFGVSVIILMIFLFSLLLMLVFASSLGITYGKDVTQSLELEDAPASSLMLHYGIIPFFIIAELIIIVGLWRLQHWAWFLLMLQVGLSMLGDIRGYFYGQPVYITMVINVIIVFYLNQREVQRIFKTKSKPVIGWKS